MNPLSTLISSSLSSFSLPFSLSFFLFSLFNTFFFSDDDEENEEEFAIEHCVTPESYIEEVEHEHYVNNTIYHGLSLLDERSRDIVTSRWLVEDKKSLLELGNKYNVSQERIRQIESSALLKIKNSVEHVSIF